MTSKSGTGQREAAKQGRPRMTLGIILLLSMLLIVLLSVGSTFVFSNLAVQNEVHKLPPEVQAYLRAQQQAERQGQRLAPMPPVPQIRTGTATGPYLPPGWSNPNVSGEVVMSSGQTIIEGGTRIRPDGGRTHIAGKPRAKDFLQTVQNSLRKVGLIAALASALLAWWLSRRIARPITQVSTAALQLAQGDLSARAPVLKSEREVAELSRAFNEMAENLQILERERQQAAADIAHELRTPIAIMQARLDAVEDGVYPMNAEQIGLLSAQTQLLSRLVGDLRTLTLADAGRLALRPGATDLAELSAQVVRDLTDRATQRGLSLQFTAAPAPLQADSDRLRQLVANLIENALRHAHYQIEVRVESQETEIRLHVDDDGPGIPVQDLGNVFTRFTRLDESRSRDTGGSGLGLAIVRALAAAHGGNAYADRSPLGGARFTVTFPQG